MAVKPQAKKSEQKQESSKKAAAEPSYADLLALAQQNLENKNFQAYAKVSGYDVAAPYYGEQAQPQLQAASEYAKMLAADQAAKVTIPEEYYANLQRQVPVLVDAYIPAYNKTKDFIGMPAPPLFQQYYAESEQNAIKNKNHHCCSSSPPPPPRSSPPALTATAATAARGATEKLSVGPKCADAVKQ